MKPSGTYTLILAIALFCFAAGLTSCSGGSSSSAPALPSASSLAASCTSATVGSSYSCAITVSSGKAPFTWVVTGLPSGLSFTVSADTTTLTISGTPKAQAAHHAEVTEEVQITVTDAQERSAILSFGIAVTTTALTITTPSPLPAGTAGTAYTAMVTASGGVTPYKWTISGLPAGLTPTSGTPSATISGTTDDVGTFSVTATVSDSESTPATASVTLSLTIAQAATLTVTPTTLPDGTLNAQYSQTLAATGGVSPYRWTVASGTLPTGLLLSTAGVISGMPSVSGSFSFTVQASDAESPAQAAKQALSITINATSTSLSITTTSSLAGATLNSVYTATVTATGGTQPYKWTLGTSSTLPPGFSPLTSGTPSATLSGTPTATGTFKFTLVVTDAASNTASASFLLTVTGSSTLNCPTTVNLTLCGTYLIGIGGFNSSGGPTALGSSFVANNSGDVISGVKAANDSVAGYSTSTITGGSYVMDSSGDGRGVLTLIDSDANTTVFRFVLESAANAGPGVIEEFESNGTLASGAIFGPGTPPLTPLPANGVFGLVLEGLNSAGDRARVLGMMKIGASGCDGSSGSLNSLSGEPVVSNVAGTVDKALTLTGSCTASDPNTGVGTAQLTISGGTPFSNTTLNFVYLNLSGEGALFLEKDAVAGNQPVLAGIGLGIGPPTGGFNASSLGCPCILDAQGATNGNASTGGAISSIVRIVTTPGAGSSGTLAGVLDQNAAGSVTLEGAWPYASYTVDSSGVGTITGTGSTVHFVATGSGGNGFTFYTLDESTEVQAGTFRKQNATSIGNPNSPYIMGRDLSIQGITHTTDHVLGVITPTGATLGSLTGTADVISSSGSFPGVSVTGSYMSIDATTGRGTGTANLTDSSSAVSIVMYVTRGRQFLILDVQSFNPYVVGARLQ
jgi:hypothetical protein